MPQDPAGPSAVARSRPLLTVVRGTPTVAELAAVTVVMGTLARRGRHPAVTERPRRSPWAARERMLRPQLHPGAGAWRASALPR
jgi:Acyl-CoA carboxylase epsilon subunit